MEGDESAPTSLCDFLGKAKLLSGVGMAPRSVLLGQKQRILSGGTGAGGHPGGGSTASMKAISPLTSKVCFHCVLFTVL